MPSGVDLKRVSLEIFSGLAGSYDRVLDLATLYQDRRWKGWVASRMGRMEDGLVLDVGCGTMIFESAAARPGHRFVGVDLSSDMIRRGRSKPAPNVGLVANADADHLPFADETFDYAVSFYVAKYVDLPLFTSELARVTRPGGEVLLYDFANPHGAMSPILQLYVQGGLRVIGLALTLMNRPEAVTFEKLPWIIRGTRWDSEILAQMKDRGFRLVETARLAGGAAFAYRGVKEPSNLSGTHDGGRRR